MREQITVQVTVTAPVETAWDAYNNPAHIMHWAFASDDWTAPYAENDLRIGGRFLTRMEAKDGSAGFDFIGTYDNVIPNQLLEYTMDGDERKAKIVFEGKGNSTDIIVSFDPENINPIDMQRGGWQSILDNFKKYVEGLRS